MKVAILGGKGFVGTNLSRHFSKRNIEYVIGDLKCEDRDPQDIKLDVRDITTLEKLPEVDAVVNLAAEHRDDVQPISEYQRTNVDGARVVCDYCRNKNINTIIFTSSVAVYGFAPENTDESGAINYFNEYGRTKYEAELVYKAWLEEAPETRKLVIVRPTVIFGEGNRGNVYNLLRQIASGYFVMFGSGKNIKSMAYVENIVNFLASTLTFKQGLHLYNYIDKPDLDMNQLISKVRGVLFNKHNVGLRLPAWIGILIGFKFDILAKITGKRFPVSSIRVKKFMGTTQFDTSIPAEIFQAPVPLSEAIQRTVEYEFIEDNSDKDVFYTE